MNEMAVRLMRGKIVPAVLSIVMGIALILARRAAMEVIVRIFGIMIAVGGVGFIALYFFGPAGRDATALIAGIAAAAIGLLMFFYADAVDDFFLTLLGIMLVLNGLSNIANAGMNGEERILTGLFGVLVVVLGVLVVIHPGRMADGLMIYAGIFFVVNGVADLFLLYRMKEVLLGRTAQEDSRNKDE